MSKEVSTVIYASIDDVVFSFIDTEEVKKREAIKEIRLIEGINNTHGARYKVEYQAGAVHTRQIIDIELPGKISYLIEEMHELQEHTFREHDDHIHYKLKLSYTTLSTRIYSKILSSMVQKKANSMMNQLKIYCEDKKE